MKTFNIVVIIVAAVSSLKASYSFFIEEGERYLITLSLLWAYMALTEYSKYKEEYGQV